MFLFVKVDFFLTLGFLLETKTKQGNRIEHFSGHIIEQIKV